MNVVKTLIGFAVFFILLIFRKKSKILMHLSINAPFEFNSNPSAGSDVNRPLQIRFCKGRKKRTISSSESVIYFRFPLVQFSQVVLMISKKCRS